MEKLGIRTTQNVFINYEIASLGDRIIGQLLDLTFITVYFLSIIFILSAIKASSGGLIMIFSIPVLIYSLIFELIFNGQTPGKMIINTKVVKMDGSEPTFVSYFLRWIFRLIDIWFVYASVGIITIIINGKGQRLGDIVAKTTVIKLKKYTGLENTIFRQIPEDYKLVYKEVNLLEESDIHTIREVLKHYYNNRNETSSSLLIETIRAIAKKTGITFNNQLDPRYILETLLNDYNFIYQIKEAKEL